jgi:hypothetical protein
MPRKQYKPEEIVAGRCFELAGSERGGGDPLDRHRSPRRIGTGKLTYPDQGVKEATNAGQLRCSRTIAS